MAALAGGCVVVLAGCASGSDHPVPSVTWHESSLPTPAGARAVVRDASYCGGRWWVVGATADPEGRTHPAVWSSPDAARWQVVRLDPGGDFYAAREILGSVGCSAGRIAVLGAKPGGAHGMPRTATWRQRGDGSLVAVRASFALYGGVRAVRVNRILGGAHGFLIAGTRSSGAAVWRSADGRSFRIQEGAPRLASTAHSATQGFGAAWYDGTWWVVGSATDDAGYVSAMSWTPVGAGSFARHPLPGGGSISIAEQAAVTPKGLLAVGLDGQAFGAWTLSGGSWSKPTTFGRQDTAGVEPAYVAGLAVTGDEVVATYSDGVHFRLAMASHGGAWADLPAPEQIAVTGDRQLAISGGDGRFLLLGDDGTRGRVWVGTAPG